MTPDDTVRLRWFALVAIRIVTAIGAVFGLVLMARATATPMRVLGAAIILSALYVMAVVPRSLAHRWRS